MSVKEPGKRLPTFREPEFSGPCNYLCSKCWAILRVESPESPDIAEHEAIHTEHARLQAAVVGAAKAYHIKREHGRIEEGLLAAVDRLIAFEAEHKIGE
jgi:hypothetical protein